MQVRLAIVFVIEVMRWYFILNYIKNSYVWEL